MDDLEEYAMLEAAVDGKPPLEEAAAANGAGGEKPRDSSRGRDREEGDKERSSKDKRRQRSRSRSRDRKRSSRERERRSDRSDRDRDRDRRPEREHHRGGGGGGGGMGMGMGRPRSPPRRRAVTPPEVRRAREKERELKELERATRTVFAYNMSSKADERDIWGFFSKVGEVTDIRVITDRHTRKSKGMAYVEFSTQEEVFGALALTGQTFMGQPVMVKPAEAEKNVAWEAAQQAKNNQSDAAALLQAAGLAVPAAAGASGLPEGGVVFVPLGPPITLRVAGFPPGLAEAELRQVFEPFGALNSVALAPDGSAEIVYARAEDGRIAMGHWNGNELIGCRLSVTAISDPGAAAAAAPPLLLPTGTSAAAAAAVAAATEAVGELDEAEGGLRLPASGRHALMARLAGAAGLPAPAQAVTLPQAPLPPMPAAPHVDPSILYAQGVLGPPSPIPTPCLLLKNVWRLEQTGELGWETEITEDMQEELSKCGQLLHMHVDTASQGFVYTKFLGVEGAQAAHRLLNGRYYQGNQIIAEFQFTAPYDAHFGMI